MKPFSYILVGKEVRVARSIQEWGEWFATADRTVAYTPLDGVAISTVFLGLDYSIFETRPLVFETMAFFDDDVAVICRYSTWAEAETGHAETVEHFLAEDDLSKEGARHVIEKLRAKK